MIYKIIFEVRIVKLWYSTRPLFIYLFLINKIDHTVETSLFNVKLKSR